MPDWWIDETGPYPGPYREALMIPEESVDTFHTMGSYQTILEFIPRTHDELLYFKSLEVEFGDYIVLTKGLSHYSQTQKYMGRVKDIKYCKDPLGMKLFLDGMAPVNG